MSNNLRDRIAAAIYVQEYPKRCEHCPTLHPSPWAYKVADAVIEALDLRIENSYTGGNRLFVELEGFYDEPI